MQRRTLLGVGALAISSGCLRLTEGNGGGNGNENGDGGPTGESDDAPGEGGVNYPIGLSEDGVTRSLARTHSNELFDRSYELGFDFRDRGHLPDRGTNLTTDGERVVIEDHSDSHEATPIVSYYDGEEMWWRQTHQDEVWYGRVDIRSEGTPFPVRPDQVTFAHEVELFIRVASYDPPVVEEDEDDPRFRLVANGVDEATALGARAGFADYNVNDLSATMVVDQNGIVRSFEGTFDVVENEQERLVETELRIRGVGETEVTPPDWSDTARERAPELDPRLGPDDRTIGIWHEGGQALPPGTKIRIDEAPASLEDRRHETELEDGLSAGDTLFVWFEDGDLQHSTDRPGGGGEVEFDENWLFQVDLNWSHYVSKPIQNI